MMRSILTAMIYNSRNSKGLLAEAKRELNMAVSTIVEIQKAY